jgi:plasmid maintenance system antidote protein VapI
MISYVFDISEKQRRVSRFIGNVRAELQRALLAEKSSRKITQQQIANNLGVNRSVINRQLMGTENLTLASVVEIAWAIGWEPYFELRKRPVQQGTNFSTIELAADQPKIQTPPKTGLPQVSNPTPPGFDQRSFATAA